MDKLARISPPLRTCVLLLLPLLTSGLRPAHGSALQGGAEEGTAVPQEPPAFFAVAEYDEARDPAADLESVVEQATAEGKRILLDVGGEWCGWCKRLDLFIQEHPAIVERLEDGFLIMKVNFSQGNQNKEFLGQYPQIHGYPHIFVLGEDGTFLHSQDTAELEEGSSYNEKAILDFLDAWKPQSRSPGLS